jgi:FKBP-type peptidyl-prolyl cis-trans isomerase FkpA
MFPDLYSAIIDSRTLAKRATTLFVAMLILAPAVAAVDETVAGDKAGDARPPRFTRVTAPDGIGIKRWNKTNGKMPGKSDTVVVHYEGSLKDGTVFDSSIKRRQPASFALNRVIPCWTEALSRLHVGEKAEVTCPPKTAYGVRGRPPKIPGNATLKFDIELLAVR